MNLKFNGLIQLAHIFIFLIFLISSFNIDLIKK
jgi:hypothetical protein